MVLALTAMTRPTGRRRFPFDVALAALVCCLAYLLVEAGYRWFQYRAILDHLVDSVLVQIPTDGQGSFVADAHTGYRYRPNMEVGPATTPFPVHYRTNEHGLIARENFPLAKPASEFRIGVIGDSFTANVTSTLRWTDVAEDALNASGAWKEITGGRTTRVINFGLDGIGVVQFGAVAETLARPFDLDLLIVNMLKDDLIRKPLARGALPAPTRADVRARVQRHVMGRLDWLALRPEVLAAIVGRHVGLAPRLTLAEV